MPQHQRTGPAWIARRVRRRVGIELDIRLPGAADHAPPSGPVPEDERPRRPRTTAEATLRPGPGRTYRRLVWGPGEPHILRDDLDVGANPDRIAGRTSILYFAQHTDAHVCDAQSPGRLEMGERFAWLAPGTDAGHRPQEHATVHVLDQMVRATNAVRISPLSGASLEFCVQTGDNTDNRQYAELRWFIDTLDGRTVTPNTGAPHYEGVQAWPDVAWAYHPDDPSGDPYGRYGFPCLPGLLASAVRPLATAGSAVPWLTVLGNHDVIWQGTFGNRGRMRLGDAGDAMSMAASKPTDLVGLGAQLALAMIDGTAVIDGTTELDGTTVPDGGLKGRLERFAVKRSTTVAADPVGRRPLSVAEQVAEYFVTESDPGPVGHGFTAANRVEGTAYWARPHGDRFLLVGLDTNNHTSGSEGRIGPRQRRWLEVQLTEAARDGRLVVVFSHHNSWTLINAVDDSDDPGRATDGEELTEILLDHPEVILWVNGHAHENRIVAHRRTGRVPSHRDPGFWEVCTASCIDFGQQSRTFEVLDNSDGTLSILVTVLDHAAPASVGLRVDGLYSPAEIASISRELAANDSRWTDPWDQRGRLEDRNVELLVGAPRR